MIPTKMTFALSDNGGRRSGIDRRKFSFSSHIPERRSGRERRCGRDRRCCIYQDHGLDKIDMESKPRPSK